MRYDVIVVGCGVAGPVVARIVARAGYSVLLIERKTEIGPPKRCAEGVEVDVMKSNDIPLDDRFINRHIFGPSFHSPGGYSFQVNFGKPLGMVIERKIFDKFLAYYAAQAGADIMPKTEARALLRKNGQISGVKVRHNGDSIDVDAEIIVAADGIESQVGKWAGIDTTLHPHDVDPSYEYEMVIDGIDFDPNFFHVYFGNEVAPRGYVWIFPKDEDRANVGVGINGDNAKTAKYYLDRWLDKNGVSRKKILEINVGGVPVGEPLREPVKQNVVVVGDAARQLFFGGGIAESIRAAAIAGKWVAKSLEEEDTSLLMNYAREWWETRGNKLANTISVRRAFERLSDDDMDAIIRAMETVDVQKLVGNEQQIVLKALIKNPRLLTRPNALRMLNELRKIA